MFDLCDDLGGSNRREFLRIGSLGLGAAALPQLLATRAAAEAAKTPLTTGKSVIFLFLHGGPSQYETFDPNMTASAPYCSLTGEVATSVPGVTFGGTFQRLAPLADKLAIVRSYRSGSGDHKLQPLICDETLNANPGSLYARVVGTNHPRHGLPTNVGLFPNAVDPDGPGANQGFGRFDSTGTLGTAYQPFIPGAGGPVQENMKLRIARERVDDRRSLLRQLDRIRRDADSDGRFDGLDGFEQQAFDVVLGGVASAFDLSREDPRTVARYDTSHLHRPALWADKNNRKHYAANAKSLGKLLLLARRLCEAGCGFVTVSTAFVWDMHADVNNLEMPRGMDLVGSPLDHALSAYVEDVEARGLSDDILLVVTGEMGRTPRANKGGGRDHWGAITPLLLYGGGLPRGHVVGQSSRDGGEPGTEPITTANLISTIMHRLFDVGTLRLDPALPGDVLRVATEGRPIPGLH
ncbi:MAG: DUF1501 domain-containing protein [Planctomycetales bacterium]